MNRLLLSAAALRAENWANWRGPLHNGSSPEEILPATFSKTDGVKCVADMPGMSPAALCLDLRTGTKHFAPGK